MWPMLVVLSQDLKLIVNCFTLNTLRGSPMNVAVPPVPGDTASLQGSSHYCHLGQTWIRKLVSSWVSSCSHVCSGTSYKQVTFFVLKQDVPSFWSELSCAVSSWRQSATWRMHPSRASCILSRLGFCEDVGVMQTLDSFLQHCTSALWGLMPSITSPVPTLPAGEEGPQSWDEWEPPT